MKKAVGKPSLTVCLRCRQEYGKKVPGDPNGLLPLTLKCGHSLCKPCISKLVLDNEDITCPTCGSVSAKSLVKQKSILEVFPVNYFIYGLSTLGPVQKSNEIVNNNIGFVKNLKKASANKVLCVECSHTASLFCPDCKCTFCDTCCDRVHSAARIFKSHKWVPIKEAQPMSVPLSCNLHPSLKWEFYCNTCDMPFCTHCLVQYHTQHSYELLKQRNAVCQEELAEVLSRALNLESRLRSTRKVAISKGKVETSPQMSPLEDEVTNHFARLHGIITTTCMNYLSQIQMVSSTRAYTHIIKQIDSYIEEVQEVINSAKPLLHNDYLPGSKTYVEAMENISKVLETPSYLVCQTSPELDNKFTVDPKIFETITTHCSLTLGNVAMPKLVTEQELPDSYEKDPINEATSTALLKEAKVESSDLLRSELMTPTTSDIDDMSSNVSAAGSDVGDGSDGYQDVRHDLAPGVTIEGYVCCFQNPSEFYIHRIDTPKKIATMDNEIRLHVSRRSGPPVTVKKGNVYLAPFYQDRRWYRVRILESSAQPCLTYSVDFIDYGNKEVINYESLRTIPRKLCNIQPYAVKCKLAHCVTKYDDTWDPEATEFARKIIDRQKPMVIYIDKIFRDHIEVQLFKKSNQYLISLQDALCFHGYAALSASCPKLDTVRCTYTLKTYSDNKSIKNGNSFEVQVSHVTDPHDFYLQAIGSLKTIKNLHYEMKTTYSVKSSHCHVYDPQTGMAVAVYNSQDNQWYRGIITAVPRVKTVSIRYVDYGIEAVHAARDIKLLLKNYYKMPPLAFHCALSGIGPLDGSKWDSKALTLFKSATNCQNLKVLIESTDSGLSKVFLSKKMNVLDISINAMLVEHGVASLLSPNLPAEAFPRSFTEQSPSLKSTSNSVSTVSGSESGGLEGSEESIANFLVPATPVSPARCKVILKHMVNPGEFYITLSIVQIKIDDLKEEINKYYDFNSDGGALTLGDKCVVKRQKWERAEILELMPDNKALLKMLDEGTSDIVDISKLRPLEPMFGEEPGGASQCYLAGLLPAQNTWSHSSITEFTEFIERCRDNLYLSSLGDIGPNGLPVELLHRKVLPAGPLEPSPDEWFSFNNHLRNIGLAKPDETFKWEVDGIVYPNELKAVSGSVCDINAVTETLKGIWVTEPVGFVCAADEDLKEKSSKEEEITEKESEMFEEVEDHLSEQNLGLIPKEWIPAKPFKSLCFLSTIVFLDFDCCLFIQDYYESLKTLEFISNSLKVLHDGSTPKEYDITGWNVGDICICQYHLDKRWYRAVVKEVGDENITVRFVDYGNIEVCQPAELRRIPGAVDVPIQSHKCQLPTIIPPDGSDKWQVEVLDSIHALVVDKHCEVELEELPTGGYAILRLTLPDRNDFFELVIRLGLALRRDIPLQKEIPAIRLKKEETPKKLKKRKKEIKTEKYDGEVDDGVVDKKEVKVHEESSEDVIVSEVDLTRCVYKENHTSAEVDLTKDLSLESTMSSNDDNGSHMSYHWAKILASLPPSECPKLFYTQLIIPKSVKSMGVELTTVMSPTRVLMMVTSSDNQDLIKSKTTFAAMFQEIQNVAPSLPSFEPCIYQPCVAQYTLDNEWYRAFVLSVLPMNQFLVQYVDYGNIEAIPSSRIRPLRKSWEDVPVQSIECVLNNLTVPPKSGHCPTMTKLSDALSKPDIIAEIISHDPLTVDLKVNGQLAYQSLIDSGDYIATP